MSDFPAWQLNVSVQYNGGLLPNIIVLLTQCYYYHRGTRLSQEEVLYLQPMIPPTKRFDMFPLTGGCSEGLGAFRFFLKKIEQVWYYSSLLAAGARLPGFIRPEQK